MAITVPLPFSSVPEFPGRHLARFMIVGRDER